MRVQALGPVAQQFVRRDERRGKGVRHRRADHGDGVEVVDQQPHVRELAARIVPRDADAAHAHRRIHQARSVLATETQHPGIEQPHGRRHAHDEPGRRQGVVHHHRAHDARRFDVATIEASRAHVIEARADRFRQRVGAEQGVNRGVDARTEISFDGDPFQFHDGPGPQRAGHIRGRPVHENAAGVILNHEITQTFGPVICHHPAHSHRRMLTQGLLREMQDFVHARQGGGTRPGGSQREQRDHHWQTWLKAAFQT